MVVCVYTSNRNEGRQQMNLWSAQSTKHKCVAMQCNNDISSTCTQKMRIEMCHDCNAYEGWYMADAVNAAGSSTIKTKPFQLLINLLMTHNSYVLWMNESHRTYSFLSYKDTEYIQLNKS